MDVDDIIQIMKVVHIREIFRVPLELYSLGAATLHMMAAMMVPDKYCERGLLRPYLDYDVTPPWFHTPVDVMDAEDFMYVSNRTDLGYDINRERVKENQVI